MRIGLLVVVVPTLVCIQDAAAQMTVLTAHRDIPVEALIQDPGSYSSGYDWDHFPSDAFGHYNRTKDLVLTLNKQWAKSYSTQVSTIDSSGITSVATTDNQNVCLAAGYSYGHSSSVIDATFLIERPMRFTLSAQMDVSLASESNTGIAEFTLAGSAGPVFTLSQRGTGTQALAESGMLQPGLYSFHSRGETSVFLLTCPTPSRAQATASVQFEILCPADFDGSGFVDLDDMAAFVRAFEDGTEDADFDGTGFVDIDDFSAFVEAFEVGC